MMNHNHMRSGGVRRYVFYGTISLATVILLLGFYNLQILQENVYREQSIKNSVKVETKVPVRGLIYDRNGRLIADNRPSFSVYLVPANTSDQTLSRVAEVLELDPLDIRKKFRRSRRFQPVKVARYVEREKLIRLQENKLDLPGLEWRVEPRRNYVVDESFAHVLGTLGEIDEAELGEENTYEPGDIVGKKGIEKALDVELRGRKGYTYVKVDALGRTVDEIDSERNSKPYPGMDVFLSIDVRLQQYADSLLEGHTGALVAVDPRSGEVLTLLSKPNYHLSWFAEAVDPEHWQTLTTDSLKPLYDRATQALYPPGSTYKMVAAMAALNEGIVTPQWSVFCPGYYRIGRRVIRCWKAEGHGEVGMVAAIRGSCNVYFYQLGAKIGIENWTKYSRLFLFGEKTGIELSSEKSGLVPSREYYDRVYGKNRWTAGMLANIAIGQGELLVTPVQMARFAMMMANSGTYYPMHLTLKLIDKMSRQEMADPHYPRQVQDIRPDVFDVVREGMRQVVAGGTGYRASVWRQTGAGKTGTAQNPHGDSHAWYIGFAPYEKPEIAVAVLLENAGSGGGVAAPIAGKFLQRYFHYTGRFDYAEYREYLRKMWLQQREQARLDSLRAAGVAVDSLTQEAAGD